MQTQTKFPFSKPPLGMHKATALFRSATARHPTLLNYSYKQSSSFRHSICLPTDSTVPASNLSTSQGDMKVKALLNLKYQERSANQIVHPKLFF